MRYRLLGPALLLFGVFGLAPCALRYAARGTVPVEVQELRAARAATVIYRDHQGGQPRFALPTDQLQRLQQELRPSAVDPATTLAFVSGDLGILFELTDGRLALVWVLAPGRLLREGPGGALIFLEDTSFADQLARLAAEQAKERGKR